MDETYSSNLREANHHGSVGCRSTDFTLSDLCASFLWSNKKTISQLNNIMQVQIKIEHMTSDFNQREN